jgi:hypothetical protein
MRTDYLIEQHTKALEVLRELDLISQRITYHHKVMAETFFDAARNHAATQLEIQTGLQRKTIELYTQIIDNINSHSYAE